MKVFILLAMIFGHLFDDFFLQIPWLANGKQKEWWRSNVSEVDYLNDYIIAMIAHAFSWTFVMMFPAAMYLDFQIPFIFGIIFLVNVAAHAFIDDQKANARNINLIMDQKAHLAQVVITWFLLVLIR